MRCDFGYCLSYLPGEAKDRHAKTRQNHHLAGFRVATFRVFAPKTRLYDMAQINHHTVPNNSLCLRRLKTP